MKRTTIIAGMRRFDLTVWMEKFWRRYRDTIVLVFLLFVVNIFVYGQRLFFYMLPSDDYMRFWGDHNTKMLITNSARWAQALLNDYVFVEKLQILPYLHTLAGIFSFTLMGFLTAHYWKRTRTIEVVAITLLISATPMFAHNLLFSTNITAWVTMLLGQIGFLAAHRKGWVWKVVGFVFLVVAIANYQTIIQVLAMMVLVRMILHLPDATSLASLVGLVRYGVVTMAYVAAAYAVAFGINELFLSYHHWHMTHRLARTDQTGWEEAIRRLHTIYTQKIDFNFFGSAFHVMYACLAALAVIAGVWRTVRTPMRAGIKTAGAFFMLTLFALVPLVVKLPMALGVEIPLRAYFPLAWVGAGSLALVFAFAGPWLRTLAALLGIVLSILNLYYVTLFFDAAQRQTDADIARARAIVERIRTSDAYEKEPMGFYIVGQKPFPVKGWRLKWQQPFDSYWARYPLFEHFTDFRFKPIDAKALREMEAYIIEHYDHVDAYPGKHSVIVYKNNAILFLNPGRINAAISRHRLLRGFPRRNPDVEGEFDVYVERGVLYYKKEQCSTADMKRRFFLRVYPSEREPRSVIGRTRIRPFQNMDFPFQLFGERRGTTCFAAIKLPDYPIARIRTGQFGKGDIAWETVYDMNQSN